MRRIIKLLLCFLLVSAILCGCSGRRTLSNLAVVEGMSIDRAANGVSVSVQTLNMTKSGNGSEALSGNITINTAESGTGISQALSKLSEDLSRNLFLGQNKITVFSSSVARHGVGDNMDYFVRSAASRPDVLLCVADGNAATVVSVTQAAGSALTKEADYTIVHGFEANYAAKLEKMGYVLALAVEILQQVEGFDKYDKMIEGLTNVFEAAENAANSARKSAKEFAEKYKDAPVVYVMSSGASMEVAYSTSICLMMEMQWVNSGSFHSGEFFHGPFEIVDKDVPFILLMNDGKTRPVDARALTFLHRFDALTTVVDAKDYGLGNAVDSSVITYFNPLMHTAVFRVYAEELSYVRQHPLTLRRYMWKLEY